MIVSNAIDPDTRKEGIQGEKVMNPIIKYSTLDVSPWQDMLQNDSG